MGLVHTIPETNVTVPTFLRGAANGRFPHEWLRSPEQSTALHRMMFVPVSYAMQAMHLAAAEDGVLLRTTGRYRTYDQQVALFRARFVPYDTGTGVKRTWQGQTWWKLPGVALAATPGTSNHGLGLADDIAEQDDQDPELESIDDVTLQWLKDNAGDFGFALDLHSERWHWHWYNRDSLTERTVEVLDAAGVVIEDLTDFKFVVPNSTPTPPPTQTQELMMSAFNILAKRKENGSFWAGNGYGRIWVNGVDFNANIINASERVINAADGTLIKVDPANPRKAWDQVTALDDADLDRLLGPWRK